MEDLSVKTIALALLVFGSAAASTEYLLSDVGSRSRTQSFSDHLRRAAGYGTGLAALGVGMGSFVAVSFFICPPRS